MTARSPGAFFLSVMFHALVIGAIFVFTVLGNESTKPASKVLELVAGPGENYAATVAPALGSETGIKLKNLEPPPPHPNPITPAPEVEPEPVAPPPSPITPAPQPTPKPVPTPAPKKAQPMSHKILNQYLNAKLRAEREIARARAAEERRAKAAAAAAEKQRVATAKIQHIDGVGIAKGVIGGSADNTVGGAGGTALVATEGSLSERYFALLKERVQNALDKPPDLSDDLAVTVVVHIAANGRLSNAHVVKSSGSEEFDRAVIAAFGRVTMPEHPEHKNEDLELIFRTKDSGHG